MLRTIVGFALFIINVSPGLADRLSGSELPFSHKLSNTVPLVFGMTSDEAALALGTPLHYVSGRTGEETLLAIRTLGGGGFFPRADRLFLQFRRGHLTGFKGDWGNTWMWR